MHQLKSSKALTGEAKVVPPDDGYIYIWIYAQMHPPFPWTDKMGNTTHMRTLTLTVSLSPSPSLSPPLTMAGRVSWLACDRMTVCAVVFPIAPLPSMIVKI